MHRLRRIFRIKFNFEQFAQYPVCLILKSVQKVKMTLIKCIMCAQDHSGCVCAGSPEYKFSKEGRSVLMSLNICV